MKIVVEIDDAIVSELIQRAISGGFKREEPRTAWKDKERRQAVRFAIDRLVKEAPHVDAR